MQKIKKLMKDVFTEKNLLQVLALLAWGGSSQ